MALRVVKLVACGRKGSFRVDRSRPIVGRGCGWVSKGLEVGSCSKVCGERGVLFSLHVRSFLHSARAKSKTATNDGAVYTSVTLQKFVCDHSGRAPWRE